MNTNSSQRPSALRWAVLAACCMAGACFQLSAMCYAPLLGEIAKSLQVDLPTALQLMTYFMFFSSISFFVGGSFVDRFGPEAAITVSVLLAFLPTLSTLWFGDAYYSVVAIRILQGFTVGFCMAGIIPMVMQWFAPEQRAFALGITGAFIPLGAMLGVVVTPAAFSQFGDWKQAMAVVSVIPFVVLCYCLFIFHYSKGKEPQFADKGPMQLTNENQLKIAMTSPITWIGVAVVFAANWLMQTVFSLTPSYFAEPAPVGLGMGPLVGGSMTTILQTASIIAPVIGGYIAGRFFQGRPGSIIATGLFLVIVYGGLQFSAVYDHQAVLTLFLIVPGLGIGMLMPMLQAKIAETYHPSIVGRMNGIWMGIGSFGGTAGLFISAQALDMTGTYTSALNIISLVAVFGSALCLSLNRMHFDTPSHNLEAQHNN